MEERAENYIQDWSKHEENYYTAIQLRCWIEAAGKTDASKELPKSRRSVLYR
jgi:hypothetical protein